MLPGLLLFALSSTAHAVLTYSTHHQTPLAFLDSPGLLDDVLLFDAPAFPDPNSPQNTIAAFQAYVSLRSPNLGIATAAMAALLASLGIPVGSNHTTLQSRVNLFASTGLSGKKVEIAVPGCSNTVKLPSTSFSDLGLSSSALSLGGCTSAKEWQGTVLLGPLDSRNIVASVFPASNSGFGVISDIDDTIKVTNVLNRTALLQSTFLDDPQAVPNMPQLYSGLAAKLQSPQFIYVTGSPYQLYPFLKQFINTDYSNSRGPVITQNLTTLNPSEAIEFLTNNDDVIFDHKVSSITRIHTMYPQKRWLAIGDSTQKDPEVYATIFKTYPGFITCIWIRRVEGAENSQERFDTAFAGVPEGSWRVFDDSEIDGLVNVDLVGGKC